MTKAGPDDGPTAETDSEYFYQTVEATKYFY
jgi:hypothetical protein